MATIKFLRSQKESLTTTVVRLVVHSQLLQTKDSQLSQHKTRTPESNSQNRTSRAENLDEISTFPSYHSINEQLWFDFVWFASICVCVCVFTGYPDVKCVYWIGLGIEGFEFRLCDLLFSCFLCSKVFFASLQKRFHTCGFERTTERLNSRFSYFR